MKEPSMHKKEPTWPLWGDDFLAAIERHGNRDRAARAVGVTSRAVRYRIRANEALRVACDQAQDRANDELERVMYQRAIDRDVRETALTIFLAKKRMPETYGDRSEDDLGEPIELPEIRNVGDIAGALDAILAAYADGEVTGRRADRLMAILRERRESLIAVDLERQIAALRVDLEAQRAAS